MKHFAMGFCFPVDPHKLHDESTGVLGGRILAAGRCFGAHKGLGRGQAGAGESAAGMRRLPTYAELKNPDFTDEEGREYWAVEDEGKGDEPKAVVRLPISVTRRRGRHAGDAGLEFPSIGKEVTITGRDGQVTCVKVSELNQGRRKATCLCVLDRPLPRVGPPSGRAKRSSLGVETRGTPEHSGGESLGFGDGSCEVEHARVGGFNRVPYF